MPSQREIRDRVFVIIDIFSYKVNHPSQIDESQNLTIDLGLGQNLKASLAAAFNKLAVSYQSDARFTFTECRLLNTVHDCVALVCQRICGRAI